LSSNLTSPKAATLAITHYHHPFQYSQCFTLLFSPDMCNVNLDHPPAHTTKLSNLQLPPTRYKPIGDRPPSKHWQRHTSFVHFASMLLTANARFHQANASISPPIPSPPNPLNRVNASSCPSITQHQWNVRQSPTSSHYRLFGYQDFRSFVGQK